jgi:hypothetical protein
VVADTNTQDTLRKGHAATAGRKHAILQHSRSPLYSAITFSLSSFISGVSVEFFPTEFTYKSLFKKYPCIFVY